MAFKTAGFTHKERPGALTLFKAPRIQARVTAILQARASHPAVTLPEITDMLKRVYTGAIHSGEYNPAHNAAFSLARLYGLVVDRAQLDVIRRPSREPDAPAEQELSSWIAALPALSQGPVVSSVNTTQVVSHAYATEGPIIEGSVYGSDLDGGVETGNGAPSGRVTGTPDLRAHSGPSPGGHGTGTTLSTSFLHDPIHPGAHSGPGGHSETGSPFADEGTGIPSAEDLF